MRGHIFLDAAGHLGVLVGVEMGVNFQRGLDALVPQALGDEQGRKALLDEEGRVAVPLRYNYDKPEKPRTSRVFGYLARFFILFQTEKSSREVVIS